MTKEEILESKTMIEVIQEYGLRANRSGFIRCPFHTGDRQASLKIYPKSFYCFGCGKGGDIFTFVQLYEKCDFHTAFLRLGGTDRAKGEKLSRKDSISIYRAKREAEARKQREAKAKQMLDDANNDMDRWRDALSKAEPMTDEWADAFNHWLIACAKQADIMGEDLII